MMERGEREPPHYAELPADRVVRNGWRRGEIILRSLHRSAAQFGLGELCTLSLSLSSNGENETRLSAVRVQIPLRNVDGRMRE